MSDRTGIEWTDATWNPVTGCTRVSRGCENCYIETTPPFRMAGDKFRKYCPRCKGYGIVDASERACPECKGEGSWESHEIGATTAVNLWPSRLDQPLRWRKPRRVFVNSLSDLFHDEIPDEFIAEVFAVMARADRHTFQVLTKRHGRMRALLNSDAFRASVNDHYDSTAGFDGVSWPLPNVCVGVSVEDQKAADLRIRHLLGTPAAVRFLSCEPLLGPVDLDQAIEPTFAQSGWLNLNGLHWVIVGGESGPDARPMHPDWARSLRDQCADADIPLFFKQWGEWAPQTAIAVDKIRNGQTIQTGEQEFIQRVGKKAAGRMLDGRTHDDYPKGTESV